MSAAARRLEFAPPPAPGLLGALVLALAAHALLAGALAWGVQWRHRVTSVPVEAELWAAVPQEAAPVAPPPAPPAAPSVAPALPSEAEIALEQEKKRLEQEARQREQAEQEKARAQAQREKERLAALKKEEAQRRQAQQAAEEAKARELQRQENLARMSGLAGTGGTPGASAAAKSAAPSAGYGARVRARVRPNIVYSETPPNNPSAEVEVRLAPDGLIVGRKLIKSSGIKAFDEAVLRAIDKAGELPQDVDGRVPPSLIISFRPKDGPS